VGTIVQLTKEAASVFNAEFIETVETVEQAANIDAVMEELALDAFFMGNQESETMIPVTPQAVISNEAVSMKEKSTMEAVVAGLVAAVTMPRIIPEQDAKRKSQR
jgi:hypothetical protein